MTLRRHGTARKAGFIAQEVEGVLPEAVTKKAAAVPTTYGRAAVARHAKELVLTFGEPLISIPEIGATIELAWKDGKGTATVLAGTRNSLRVKLQGADKPEESEVFVTGVQVDDFRSLDYNHVFTHNVAATQELAEMVLTLQQRVAELQQQVNQVAGMGGAKRARSRSRRRPRAA